MRHIFVLLTFCVFFISCNANEEIQTDVFDDVKQICDFAVLECHYHNNAEVIKKSVIPGRSTKQWIDYGSTIKIGVDATQLKIEIEGTKVSITLPAAKIIGEPQINIDSIEILSEEGLLKQKVSHEDQVYALQVANADAKETTSENVQLMLNAQNRVKKLLENYIQQIGSFTDTEYEIIWEIL